MLPKSDINAGWWLLLTPQKNDGVSSSVGMMTFPIWWESHNPVMFQAPTSVENIWKYPNGIMFIIIITYTKPK